jgi:hypothetical protein
MAKPSAIAHGKRRRNRNANAEGAKVRRERKKRSFQREILLRPLRTFAPSAFVFRFCYFVSSTTALASMLWPMPTGPRRSAVLAFTLT